MITEEDLLVNLPHFMDERQLEKNYLQILTLYEIYARFSEGMVFKGGTAMKLFYGLDRFSEDLDFTYDGKYDIKGIISKVENTIRSIEAIYGITRQKRRGTKTSLDFEFKIAGPLYERTKVTQALELDISLREHIIFTPLKKQMMPVYPDIGTFFLHVMDIKEIFYEKIRAVITRKYVKARDLYDLAFILKREKIEFDSSIADKKLDYYNKRFSFGEFRDKLDSIDEKSWKSEMANLIADVPVYSDIKSDIMDAIK